MPSSSATAFADFVVTHRSRGLRDALAGLLKRTDYRFIGIWRFQDGKANAAVHFDRENPQATTTEEVPDTATYCCFVRDGKAPFKTPHALIDERLSSHPAREQVATYCGVPIMDSDGNVLATLCHYDVAPRDAEQVDMALMLMISAYLANNGHVPSYPAPAAS
jgi:GAF domain-containing protein